MIEFRPDRPSPYRVKRLEGQLTATFADEDAAELQDALWKIYREHVPVLADQRPKLSASLLARLFDTSGGPKRGRQLSPALLADLLAAHPARATRVSATPVDMSTDDLLFGDFLIYVFFEKWAEGLSKTGRQRAKTDGVVEDMEEWLNKHVFEMDWKVDADTGYRVRGDDGERVHFGWGAGAIAWTPLADLRTNHVLELFEKMAKAGVGAEVQRKLRSFLSQALDQAALEQKYPQELRNPVAAVPAPKQKGTKVVRKPYLPEKVELIRASFLELERISQEGLRRTRRQTVDTPAGVPIPEEKGYGLFSADFIELLAYGSLRPSEGLGLSARGVAPEEYGEDAYRYATVTQRSRSGVIFDGTKSEAFKEKMVYLLGPLPATLKRLAIGLDANDLLLPYPGTKKPFTKAQYEYWRDTFFAPIARSHGLGPESDDPYTLRHIYATLRLAAHHSVFEINQSMGTSLAGKTYGALEKHYQGKGPLDIDAAIAKARKAAGL